MPKLSGHIAIFDLDYTLTKRGTWGRFVWMNVRNRPHIWLPLLISAGWTQWQYKKGNKPRIDVKRAMMRWAMKSKTKSQLTYLADKFADNEVANGLRPGGVKALKLHKDKGDVIVIVSAAVDILVEPIARRLNIPYFLATDMAWDNRGQLSMQFASPNCYGPEKVQRFKSLLAQNSELQGREVAVMYSDSHSDIPLMQLARRGVCVHPSHKLRQRAPELGYEVVNWD